VKISGVRSGTSVVVRIRQTKWLAGWSKAVNPGFSSQPLEVGWFWVNDRSPEDFGVCEPSPPPKIVPAMRLSQTQTERLRDVEGLAFVPLTNFSRMYVPCISNSFALIFCYNLKYRANCNSI
jgi:hypothetical protein